MSMIGRIVSTSILALFALIVVDAASTTMALAQGTRVKITGLGAPGEPPNPNPPVTRPGSMPELDQEPSSLPPGSMAVPTPGASKPRRDPNVIPAEGDDKGPLPDAIPLPGESPSPSPGSSGARYDPFVLSPDRLSLGKQRVQLSVEVQASPIINLGKESTVRLVVNNESNVDASGVSVVYQLPDGLKIVSSTPDATTVPAEKALYHWSKPMLAAGNEWVIVLKVVANAARTCEHAATVTAKTGSRANSTIQEPKLKVEVTSSPGRVLKGGQVTFQIAVRNPGTGVARNVIVQAKLSSGLKHGSDDVVEQFIDEIGPSQRVELAALTVDTIAGGEQTCTVDARSPDVNPVIEDQRVTRPVDVIKPEVTVKLAGQNERYTGQSVDYKLTVHNPGTAPAQKVKVIASLPQQGGKLLKLPTDAKFDKTTRKLMWMIDQLEPGQSVDMTFLYATSTPGLYRATAEATAGELRASDTMTTDVSGIAVLDIQVTQTSRVIDVGKTNFYDITIKNSGTKEATRLLLSGNLTKNLKILKHFNVDKGDFKFLPDTGKFIFPEIDRLAVGQTITLSLEVQAEKSGPAGCHVFLGQADMPADEAPIEDVISTTVTSNGRTRAVTPKQP